MDMANQSSPLDVLSLEERTKYLSAILGVIGVEKSLPNRSTRLLGQTSSDADDITYLAIHPAFRPYLDFLHDELYPLNKAGPIVRVTKEFLPNFIDFPLLYRAFLRQLKSGNKDSVLEEMLKDSRISDEGRLHLLIKATYRLGTESYIPEWSDHRAIQRLRYYEQNVLAVPIANMLLAEELSDHLVSLFNSRGDEPIYIFDIGTGNGRTIVPIITKLEQLAVSEKIQPDYRNRLHVIGIDICRYALEITRKRLMKKGTRFKKTDQFSIPITNFEGILANFGDIQFNQQLNDYLDRADLVISGGSVMHNTNKQPFFRFLHDLLRPGGHIYLWDWSGGYSWSAPTLRVAKDDVRKIVYIDRSTGGILHKLDEGERLDFQTQIRLGSHDCSVVSEIREMDVRPIEQNLIDIWLGVSKKEDKTESALGYSGKDYEVVSAQAKADFLRLINSPEGFNFLSYLRLATRDLEQPPTDRQTPYFFIEGYGPGKFYKVYLSNAGFREPWYDYFDRIYNKHVFEQGALPSLAGTKADAIPASHAIFFAHAQK